MRWVAIVIAALVFVAMTGTAYFASATGWGLSGQLDRPVSVRGESVGSGHRTGVGFLYFGTTRRHFGGGFHGGK